MQAGSKMIIVPVFALACSVTLIAGACDTTALAGCTTTWTASVASALSNKDLRCKAVADYENCLKVADCMEGASKDSFDKAVQSAGCSGAGSSAAASPIVVLTAANDTARDQCGELVQGVPKCCIYDNAANTKALGALQLSALQQRAVDAGLAQSAIDAALNSQAPKQSLQELLHNAYVDARASAQSPGCYIQQPTSQHQCWAWCCNVQVQAGGGVRFAGCKDPDRSMLRWHIDLENGLLRSAEIPKWCLRNKADSNVCLALAERGAFSEFSDMCSKPNLEECVKAVDDKQSRLFRWNWKPGAKDSEGFNRGSFVSRAVGSTCAEYNFGTKGAGGQSVHGKGMLKSDVCEAGKDTQLFRWVVPERMETMAAASLVPSAVLLAAALALSCCSYCA